MSEIVWGAWIKHDAIGFEGWPAGTASLDKVECRGNQGGDWLGDIEDFDWSDAAEEWVARYRLRADHPIYARPEASEPSAFTTALLSAIPDDVLIAEVVRRMGGNND